MDRRQGETKRPGGGFGFSKPHKDLLVDDDTGYGKEDEMLLVSTAGAGFRAAEGSSSRGVLLEDEKKRRLSTPAYNSPPSSSLYGTSPAARRGGSGAPVAAPASGSGSGSTITVPASSQPCCQAERCTADLSEAKRYHRRHKVCEAHSKAAVVLVGGLRQRFCQQCSRFHELSEFDDTKRSCRRRLAGHNERRRKSSAESQEEGPPNNSRCRQTTDHNRNIQITMSGPPPPPAAAAATPAYKHFHHQIR